eukprot:TRINITY_DN59186_c0_g1_i1.p1 TRINITY_DN59186_c0_g1~~TRINITY_DN59186_c0_g1_i1.p1  ORF type:complete len:888 (+),score=199.27 TRINITY_DN59186_c0_g1_i1:140-2803(+)
MVRRSSSMAGSTSMAGRAEGVGGSRKIRLSKQATSSLVKLMPTAAADEAAADMDTTGAVAVTYPVAVSSATADGAGRSNKLKARLKDVVTPSASTPELQTLAASGSAAPEMSASASKTRLVVKCTSEEQQRKVDFLDGKQRPAIHRWLTKTWPVGAERASDLKDWKRRKQCDPDAKVFICTGGYADFRNALLQRGWVENTTADSKHFNLKWGKAKDINHKKILADQIVNHFGNAAQLTSKVGLTHNLKSARWCCDVDADSFYPRAFDLHDPLERGEFVLEFQLTKAESILRRFLEHVDLGDVQQVTFGRPVLETALAIVRRRLVDVDDVLDNEALAGEVGIVHQTEWDLLSQVNLDDAAEKFERWPTDADLQDIVNRRAALAQRAPCHRTAPCDAEQKEDVEQRRRAVDEQVAQATAAALLPQPLKTYATDVIVGEIQQIIFELEGLNPQHRINGSRNAWIIKPSRKSRGRGIQVVRDLREIFQSTEEDDFNWIVQKYIEQPQLIYGYKFDIRQWVLVTDWNPLKVYIWRQPYLRFAGKKYDQTCTDRSEFVHLVNNSITKNMTEFGECNADLQASGFMWFRQQYEEWLHNTTCRKSSHHAPHLQPVPYTCESFGVKFEDVAFVENEEDDDDVLPSSTTDAPLPSSDKMEASTRVPSGELPSTCTSALSQTAQPLSAGDKDISSSTPRTLPLSGMQQTWGGEMSGHAAHNGMPKKAAAADVDPDVSTDASSPHENDAGKKACEDLWQDVVCRQMEDIIAWSLLCVSDEVHHRKNSAELFGYDFMLSAAPGCPDDMKVWLIEVNSSPACDYSTPVTCPLVKKMLEDTAKVLVDLPASAADATGGTTDTGEWSLMELPQCHSKAISQRRCPCFKLGLNGVGVQVPQGAR